MTRKGGRAAASRLIDALEAAIERSADPRQAECLRAERAAALARHGRLDEARSVLRALRTHSLRRQHPELQAWVDLAQGQIEHFDSFSLQARELFLSARTLAATHGFTRVRAMAAAWQANCAYNAMVFDEMADALIEALALAPPDDHSTHTRIALIRADASRHAGRAEQAREFYARVQRHALANGDTAMLAAMMHNRATGHAYELSLADAMGAPLSDDARLVLIEAQSSTSLDKGLLHNQTLGAMAPMACAMLLSVMGEWDEAVGLFDTYLEQARREGQAAQTPRFVVSRAWSHWHAGRRDQALADLASVLGDIDTQPGPDDRAAAHGRAARLLELSGSHTQAAWHREQAQRAHAEYKDMQRRLGEALDRVSAATAGE